jgi:hypothetical protein
VQPLSSETHLLENDLVFKAEIAGFKNVEIKIDGKLINSIETLSKSDHDIVVSKSALKAGSSRIELLGYDVSGELQFRAIRNVKLVAASSNVAIEKRDIPGFTY